MRRFLIAMFCLASCAAYAAIGNVPQPGFNLIDGDWLNALAGGHNMTYASGISAAGTNQATATQLPDRIAIISIDTVGASTGANLPAAIQGTQLGVYNNTSTTVTIYPQTINNPLTSAQDTINNTTSVTIAGHTREDFACAKNGVWSGR